VEPFRSRTSTERLARRPGRGTGTAGLALLCVALVALAGYGAARQVTERYRGRVTSAMHRILAEHARSVRLVARDAAERRQALAALYREIDADPRFQKRSGALVTVRRTAEGYETLAFTLDVGEDWAPRIPHGSPSEEVLQRATRGESGTWEGRSPTGRPVLVEYGPVGLEGWGALFVADRARVESDFLETSAAATSGVFAVALAGLLLLQRRSHRLREEARLGTALSGMIDEGFLLVDPDGSVISSNPAARAVFRLRPGEAPGRMLRELVFAEESETRRPVTTPGELRALPAGAPLLAARSDGIDVPIEVSVAWVELESRARALVLVRDVSERRQAEAALALSERRHRELLARSPASFGILSSDATWLYANPAMAEALQRSSGELFGRLLQEVVGPEDQEEVRELLARSGEGERAEGLLRVPAAGGGLRTLLFRITRFRQEDHREALLCGATDVTEQIEARLRLEAAHGHLNEILAALPSILIGFDHRYRVRHWNPTASAVLGPGAEEALGREIHALPIDWPWPRLRRAADACLCEHTTRHLDDLSFRRPDGSDGLLSLTLTSLDDPEGGSGHVLLVGLDVTERRALERQLGQAQKLESIGQLAAGIAHEINTPIQYVGDNVGFLREGFEDLAEALEAFEALAARCREAGLAPEELARVDEAVEQADLPFLRKEIPQALEQSADGLQRVTRIVRAMKDFSHPGAENSCAVDLNQCLESTATVARNEWKYVSELETRLDADLPLVEGRPAELNQVFLNLIVNAAHAIGEVVGDGGREKGRIVIASRPLGDEVEISVSDTGCGMSDAVRERLFDPFFTTKEVGRGTGQGLAIAHQVVERHGGRFEVESAPGEGSCFRLYLPVRAEGAASEAIT